MPGYTDAERKFSSQTYRQPIAHEPECVYAGKPHYAHMTSCVNCDNIRAQRNPTAPETPQDLTRTEMVDLLTLAIDTIDELSEQQAMPDPWYEGAVTRLTTARNALTANTPT